LGVLWRHYSVPARLDRTIHLLSRLPTITQNLTIIGPTPSPGITIDGGGAVQLMQEGSGFTLNLQFLTLANGNAMLALSQNGGAIGVGL
jgi:hypothetical protein